MVSNSCRRAGRRSLCTTWLAVVLSLALLAALFPGFHCRSLKQTVGAPTVGAPTVGAPTVGAPTDPATPVEGPVETPGTVLDPVTGTLVPVTPGEDTATPGDVTTDVTPDGEAGAPTGDIPTIGAANSAPPIPSTNPDPLTGVPTSNLPIDNNTTTSGAAGAPTAAPTSDLIAPDGFKYDFNILEDVDYVRLEAPLPFNNMTQLDAAPPEVLAKIPGNQAADSLLTWDRTVLNYNRNLKNNGGGNRQLKEALEAIREFADVYMDEPVYECTNKSVYGPPQPRGAEPDYREYISLSDYYWPNLVSYEGDLGLPYTYRPSVNLQNYDITPNKVHLEQTIEHVYTLTLANYLFNQPKYAERARLKVVTWFLHPEKGMRPRLRYASLLRGKTTTGRPQGIFDFADLPLLLNAVKLLESTTVWTPQDTEAMRSWISSYANWLETDPLPRYARSAGDYIAASFDEQLLACYMYLERSADAARIAYWSRIRRQDQIQDGVLRYERESRRSLDFTQAAMQSWANIAKMGERLGLNLWTDGLVQGYSIKDALDTMRPFIESQGDTWPFQQVGVPRVRIATQLLVRLYVAFRLNDRENSKNSGPREYIKLHEQGWPAFSTSGAQTRAMMDRLVNIEFDSKFVKDGVPLVEPCTSLSCDTRTIVIWGIAGGILCLVGCCLVWNVYIHWRAKRATEVPPALRRIRKRQAELQQLHATQDGTFVAPQKPDYVVKIREQEQEAARKAEEDASKQKESKAVQKEIRKLEEKLQKKKESRMQSLMQSQMQSMGGTYMYPGYSGTSSMGFAPPMYGSAYGSVYGAPSVQGSQMSGSHMSASSFVQEATYQPTFHPSMQPVPGSAGRQEDFSFQQPYTGSNVRETPRPLTDRSSLQERQ